MKITEIETFLVDASGEGPEGRQWGGRNWLFVKVSTDEGIHGLGEASGWPRVVETAIQDLTPVVVGENPFQVENIWQRMLQALMGHGLTGVIGGGAMTGIETALWDIQGKALGRPVYDLLGGKCRDEIRVYAHGGSGERARELLEEGITGIKTGASLKAIRGIRDTVGDAMDIMVDIHGPPWFTVPDAVRFGQGLKEYDVLFYEDPVANDNLEALAQVKAGIEVPMAAGERQSTIYGFRELIERDIVDVVQPDMGRSGGLLQTKKVAAMAEAHFIMVAPHDGSNGPIAEAAAVHLMATLPNFLILEHLADDCALRYDIATELPVVNGHIRVPDAPGLGVELDEALARRHPSRGNVRSPVAGTMYVEAKKLRARFFADH